MNAGHSPFSSKSLADVYIFAILDTFEQMRLMRCKLSSCLWVFICKTPNACWPQSAADRLDHIAGVSNNPICTRTMSICPTLIILSNDGLRCSHYSLAREHALNTKTVNLITVSICWISSAKLAKPLQITYRLILCKTDYDFMSRHSTACKTLSIRDWVQLNSSEKCFIIDLPFLKASLDGIQLR